MGLETIVCLANSYKHEHRCVAGICLKTKRWIRLVGRTVPGCVTLKEATYPGGKLAAPLDLFEAELSVPCGTAAHPEDTYITSRPWRFLRRFDPKADRAILAAQLQEGPTILHGYGDRLTAHQIEEKPLARSLELVKPDDLWWWIREEKGKRKYRALFRVSAISHIRYDFSVTDPSWLDLLHNLPTGIHPDTLVCGNEPSTTIFCASLSEDFHGFHYKLVATVLRLPN